MDSLTGKTLRQFLLPGGLLLLVAAVLLQGRFLVLSPSAVDFYYYAVFLVAIPLAWRFHSSRILFALATLLLAHRALEFFANGHGSLVGPGRIAVEAVALLLPINFVIASVAHERGLTFSTGVSRLGVLFLEAVFVAVSCRPGETAGPWFLRATPMPRDLLVWTTIPQPGLIVLGVALVVLLVRFHYLHKPLDSGLFWSLAAAACGLQAGGSGKFGSAYFATAGLALAASIVENSYFLAYHDELTALPSRRAFQDAIHGLEPPYAVAVVDIDHFKSFNDTYGHDTGDQVLRMVAMRLAAVSGSGRAYRIGGEEFAVLFPRLSTREAVPHLELLREAVAKTVFRFRGPAERRSVSRGPDRRRSPGKRTAQRPRPLSANQISVTISIGVADASSPQRPFERVLQSADQALYRAKRGGRNRVETATASRSRSSRTRRSIA